MPHQVSLGSSPPVSSVHEIFQARILECIAIFCSEDLPDPGTEPTSLALTDGFFTTEPPRKPIYWFIQEMLEELPHVPASTVSIGEAAVN